MSGKRLYRLLAPVLTLAIVLGFAAMAAQAADEPAAATGPVKVQVVKKDDGSYQLLRDGKPYFIKGAGGDASKKILVEVGGNSFRTWGIGQDTPGQLDEAQKLGLTVTLGTWLGHKSYFSYSNEAQNAEQKARVKREVEQYKNHPAVLLWALGNEMEQGFNGDDAIPVWKHIQELAKMVHEIDPNHPTMTVVAELGGNKIKLIHQYCPDLDIIGINSYAGCGSIGERYVKDGGTKPYIITEFGPPGVWECNWMKDQQGLMREFNSTEKAKWYSDAYKGTIIEGKPLSLGCYAFAWGSKQEATATWYGLIMSDGSHTQAVDVLSEFWTGKPLANRAPVVKSAKIEGVDPAVGCVVQPGGLVKASAEIEDPQGLPITYKWSLTKDAMNYNTGGENQAAPPSFPTAILKDGAANVEVKIPATAAAYRLYLFAYNGKGGVATLNFPIMAKGEPVAVTPEEKAAQEAAAKSPEAKLPLVVYAEAGDKTPYNPTGFMPAGIGTVLTLDAKSADNPHAGKTSLKVSYADTKGWGGVVWQNPDNDWGQKPGGYNVTGAKVLTFWARGAKGGEKATFGVGLLSKDPKKEDLLFWDTGKAELKDVILTSEWKQYTMPLAGKDLSRIKTGFWFVTGPTAGAATTFYLDDIAFLAEEPAAADTKPADAKPADAKPADAKPADAKPADAKPADAKPVDAKPADAKPADAKPAEAKADEPVPQAKLPLVLFADGMDKFPYNPTGFMPEGIGKTMTLDAKCTDNPHVGKTCIKVDYNDTKGWGGIVWQNPDNDWGKLAGGYNLTGAKVLTFWARGAKGGEKATFGFGLLTDKAKNAFYDTGKGELKDLELTKNWHQYFIYLDDKDLSRVKTAFWLVTGPTASKPTTFYLSDIAFVGDDSAAPAAKAAEPKAEEKK